jgi:hypothetical protein
MAYKLNGKFVSKEKWEAAQLAGAREKNEVEPVSEETETKTRKPRTVDPITSATARVRKAKRELDRVTKLWEKRTALPSLDDAQAEYDAATAELQNALGVV